jgi:hypothetical protein
MERVLVGDGAEIKGSRGFEWVWEHGEICHRQRTAVLSPRLARPQNVHLCAATLRNIALESLTNRSSQPLAASLLHF